MENDLPRLRQFAKIWTLLDQPSAEAEWSPEEKAAAAKEAGFDGVHGGFDQAWSDACDRHELLKWGEFDLGEAPQADALLKTQVDFGAPTMSVQVGDHDTSTEQSLELALALQEAAERHEAHAAVEVHRDTCTETPEKVNALIDAYREKTGKTLPINYDFSHPMVVKHLMPSNYCERLFDRPEMITGSHMFHLRPSTGHQNQIPVTDGQGGLIREFQDWLQFVEDLFVFWLKGPSPVRELYVCPELGPKRQAYGNYCLSIYPDPWQDAIRCRTEIAGAWERALEQFN